VNIFYTSSNHHEAAVTLCDKHITKMPVETVQMLVSALNRHNIDHRVMTKDGKLHRGGYKHHPCTVWAGESRSNAFWLMCHGYSLCSEFGLRFGHMHFAFQQLGQVHQVVDLLPDTGFTEPYQAMPDELKIPGDPVAAYRQYMQFKVNSKPSVFTWRNAPHRKPAWIS